MKNNKTYTEKEYWMEAQGGPIKSVIYLNKSNIIYKWVRKTLDSNLNRINKINTAIEIGCYPGKFLTILDKEIEINGIDYIPEVESLKNLFDKEGFTVGEFINTDFLTFEIQKKYDCVMSFGFIEHFSDWEDVMKKHFDMVNDGGIVFIEVPNFKGLFQLIPRFLFDKENFKRHNLSSMNIEKWTKLAESNGLKVLDSGYFGGYDMWIEKKDRTIWEIKIFNLVMGILRFLVKILRKINKESKYFSCVMGIALLKPIKIGKE
jgi:2-polyprenyl-3-methyl-5-hydroxy-6-metoxy-1,4-benzoquinol methylase